MRTVNIPGILLCLGKKENKARVGTVGTVRVGTVNLNWETRHGLLCAILGGYLPIVFSSRMEVGRSIPGYRPVVNQPAL